MASPFVLGAESNLSLNELRYFYALRKDDDGTLFVSRVDLNDKNDSINLFQNLPPVEFESFTMPGDDYFDNRSDTTKELTHPRDEVKYEQWRWDSRLLSYFIDGDGNFTIAINEDKNYAEEADSYVSQTQVDMTTPFTYTVNGRIINKDLRGLLINDGWNGTSPVVVINVGNITSNLNDIPALTIAGSYPNGITLINNGKIFGATAYSSHNGDYTAPGNAIEVSSTDGVTIVNNGQISGGYSLSSAADGYAIKGISNVDLTNTGTIGTTI